jgi:hypothetical protein
MGILHDSARCDDRRSEEIHDFKGLKSSILSLWWGYWQRAKGTGPLPVVCLAL